MKVKHERSQYLAELIGTFFLIFFGCGSMVLAETNVDYAGGFIPVIWGGVVSIMIYALGHISGAHFNPAVTISFFVIKKFPGRRLFGYITAQTIGALIACLCLYFIFGAHHSFGATNFSINMWSGVVVEIILSFVLMFVITSVATDSRAVGELAGIAIGSTVALCAFVGGPLTKASMNPARSFAPALFSGELISFIPYLFAPIVGAIFGAVCYEFIRCSKEVSEDQDKHGCC